MKTQTVGDSTTLRYRQGSSNKTYCAAIEPSGTGFIVTFAFGRTGTTLQTGAKTTEPVDYATAKKIFDALVASKMRKGYTPGADGTPYQHTDKQDRATGILPQLLNPIEDEDLPRLIAADEFWMQEKFDGKRVLIRKEHGRVEGINRRGLIIDLPQPIVQAVQRLDTRTCVLDGEAIGERYIAFDLLHEAALNLRSHPYRARYDFLFELIATNPTVPAPAIRCASTAIGAEQKQELLHRLRSERKEGVVFKSTEAAYAAGRPASGGPWLKHKFYATASCIVAGRNGSRRSVRLELLDGKNTISVGSVTIPANHAIPAKGDVCEIRYLYMFPGGSLYQPVYLGRRDDVPATACTVGQLKFKSDEADSDR